LDRDSNTYSKLSDAEKAARLIYLNRTCFNGLYRVSKKGYFNTPIGRFSSLVILDEKNLREISNYLNIHEIEFQNIDFENSVNDAKNGDFVYFDPPYDYEETGFTGYVKEGFAEEQLLKLKKTCDDLISRGCKVLISNNATKRVISLFADSKYAIKYVEYTIKPFEVRRYVGAAASTRKLVKEVLIFGPKNLYPAELDIIENDKKESGDEI
jgi:DNA adenine methylase